MSHYIIPLIVKNTIINKHKKSYLIVAPPFSDAYAILFRASELGALIQSSII